MRINLIAATSFIILASCSSTKHTYRDFNSTSSPKLGNTLSKSQRSVDNSPLSFNSLRYTASIDHTAPSLLDFKSINITKTASGKKIDAPTGEVISRAEAARRFKENSKAQRKEFRKAMRSSMRRYIVPSTKKSDKTKQAG